MNTLKNKINLIGRLGVQPEIMNFDSGRKLARFTLATKERYKNKQGEWQEEVSWHVINTWGKTAERVEKILQKGQEILLEGKLVSQNYKTSEGVKRNAIIIEASEFILLNKPSTEAKK
ncbi:MAG: single-stranded DNA-binding protein [Flavobacteriia bacterium]|nr:single-stranded DNA-binding protein [Flavobacteriia bacterium]